jgi:hypothetical protein
VRLFEQAWHWGHDPVPQQTLFTQNVDWHWSPDVHPWPAGSLGVHVPLLQ